MLHGRITRSLSIPRVLNLSNTNVTYVLLRSKVGHAALCENKLESNPLIQHLLSSFWNGHNIILMGISKSQNFKKYYFLFLYSPVFSPYIRFHKLQAIPEEVEEEKIYQLTFPTV